MMFLFIYLSNKLHVVAFNLIIYFIYLSIFIISLNIVLYLKIISPIFINIWLLYLFIYLLYKCLL